MQKFFVGADGLLRKMQENMEWAANNVASYPPFNLKKVDENKSLIEMAVAGFAKQNIEIVLEGDKLIINGTASEDNDVSKYIHMGIANRAFTRKFTLADNVVIDNAELVNGMLKIFLEQFIPEKDKPRKIEIKEKE
jgi:molecular chaperone IbpA